MVAFSVNENDTAVKLKAEDECGKLPDDEWVSDAVAKRWRC